jgi:hypothetical protein
MTSTASAFSPAGFSSNMSSFDYHRHDFAEIECLEHYEVNLEKYKGKFNYFYVGENFNL